MEYTPVEWHTGDVITEEKLNSMVSGITEGVSEVTLVDIVTTYPDETHITYTLEKTYKEIYEAKLPVVSHINEETGLKAFGNILAVGANENSYIVMCEVFGETMELTSETEDGYPNYTTTVNEYRPYS